jgi:hypothetical protein
MNPRIQGMQGIPGIQGWKVDMKSLGFRRWHLAFAVVLAPALIGACTGSVSKPGETPGSGGTTAAGTGGAGAGQASNGGSSAAGTGGTTGVMVVGPGVTAVAESAGPLALRRLTHREFNHTVQDLLGDTTNPADSWSVDDGSTNSGFQAPNAVDKTTLSFIEPSVTTIAESAIADKRVTIPCTNPAAGAAETTCATQFITTFGRRAYRRPVTDLEKADLLTVFTTAHTAPISYDFTTSLTWVLKAMLLSPNFLYHHWEIGSAKLTKQGSLVNLTQYQIASRLSYLLWESMPDNALLDAADAGTLSTPDQIAAQAQRMLADKAHTSNAMYNFHSQWLVYPNLGQIAKDVSRYAVFSNADAFNAAFTSEISSFVSAVMLGGDGTLKTLFTAPYAFANATTAPLYGKALTGAAMQRVDLDPTQRAGILTQTAFLAAAAKEGTSDPIARGKIVYEQVLCGTIPALNFMPPEPPKIDGVTIVTTRQMYAAHDSMPCATCHKSFDGLGFGFENYDAVGSYRQMENGQAVDATGTAETPIMKTPFAFKNGVEMATFLASNDEVKSCVTRQWFRYLLGRLEIPADEGSMQAAAKLASANPAFSLTDLLIGMVRSMDFRMRTPGAGEAI